MPQPVTQLRALPVSGLSQSEPTVFDLRPEQPELDRIAAQLGIDGLRKLRFDGTISPEGKHGWRLAASLGATVVQPCIATLAPVTTRIEDTVERRYLPGVRHTSELPEEMEMPEDETVEPLGSHIDPDAVMREALALALPLYPRADGAAVEETQFTEPGKTPMRDEDTKPFAGLAALKGKLNGDA